MIFWICVIFLILSTVIWALFETGKLKKEFFLILGVSGAVSFGIIVVVMLFILCSNHLGAEGQRLACEQRYESLLYKINTETCRDEFGMLNKSYIDEIQAWNEDVVRYKSWENDFWIGVFIPNIFDNFKTIDLHNIEYRQDGV